jgi:hypothetical protein
MWNGFRYSITALGRCILYGGIRWRFHPLLSPNGYTLCKNFNRRWMRVPVIYTMDSGQ